MRDKGRVHSQHQTPADRRVGQRIGNSQKKPPIDPDALKRELEEVALGDAPSGRAAVAKVTALRALEKMGRPARDDGYPVDDDGRFHPGPPESWDLYRCDSDETRERWRASWERSPQGRRWRA